METEKEKKVLQNIKSENPILSLKEIEIYARYLIKKNGLDHFNNIINLKVDRDIQRQLIGDGIILNRLIPIYDTEYLHDSGFNGILILGVDNTENLYILGFRDIINVNSFIKIDSMMDLSSIYPIKPFLITVTNNINDFDRLLITDNRKEFLKYVRPADKDKITAELFNKFTLLY